MKAISRLHFTTLLVTLLFVVVDRLSAQLVNIETVTVGDAGNAADTRTNAASFGFGSVSYQFAIGKYEVTIGQYATFLNSVASVVSDAYIVNLWNPNMASNLNTAGISRAGSGTSLNPYVYAPIGPSGTITNGAISAGDRPIGRISWFDAARFANWVNNGAVNGAGTETGAYTLNGATNGNAPTRNAGALWWIPTENEWYKAAYYKGGGTNAGYWLYPTKSDVAPDNNIGGATNQANYFAGDFAVTQASNQQTGQNYLTEVGAFFNSASAYGTFDQGGNVWEWTDQTNAPTNLLANRGADWNDDQSGLRSTVRILYSTTTENVNSGFRLATVPEPSIFALLLMAGVGVFCFARWRQS